MLTNYFILTKIKFVSEKNTVVDKTRTHNKNHTSLRNYMTSTHHTDWATKLILNNAKLHNILLIGKCPVRFFFVKCWFFYIYDLDNQTQFLWRVKRHIDDYKKKHTSCWLWRCFIGDSLFQVPEILGKCTNYDFVGFSW